MIIGSEINFYNSVFRLKERKNNIINNKIITISCKNAAFNLLCFISLAKQGEIIADNLVNFKSRSA